MVTFGPLFQLEWFGTFCPCLEKEEDRNGRQAIRALKNMNIVWIRSPQTRHSVVDSVASSFSTLKNYFRNSTAASNSRITVPSSGSASNSRHGDIATNSSSNSNSNSNDNLCRAQLVFRDNPDDGEPEILVQPWDESSTGYKLQFKLRRVDRVVLEGNNQQIVLYAKRVTTGSRDTASKSTSSSPSSTSVTQTPPKELLRFEPIVGQGGPPASTSASAAATSTTTTGTTQTAIPITDEERNLRVHHLQVLVEWERQRRTATGRHGTDIDDDDDEDDQPNFLAARAAKAAHFAKREIEMQQTRRDREKRKASLVADAGGLKYTALAMANRGTSA